jgi:release factor glutamine methyltransferase
MSAITIREILTSGSNQLCNIETARLDSEILLSIVMNKDRKFFYAHPEQPLTDDEQVDFNSLITKRSTGYPVAYLTGTREFWSLQINVDHSTLIPRAETECLVSAALDCLTVSNNSSILDLGTGSGAIAIALAKERPQSKITASDISSEALLIASKNAFFNNLDNIQFLKSDWFQELDTKQFDLIISNPPYVDSTDPGFKNGEIQYEPRLALDGGHSGLDAYHQIIPTALNHLNYGATIILEHAFNQGEHIRQYLQENGYISISTILDYSGHERVTMARTPE